MDVRRIKQVSRMEKIKNRIKDSLENIMLATTVEKKEKR